MKRVAFVFPGQGSQATGMGKDFFDKSDIAKTMFEEASSAIGEDMKALLFEENDKLSQSLYTQPAILLTSAIADRLLKEATGITPVYAMGHSLGEFSALLSVGALNLGDAAFTVHNRGKWMAEACEGKDAGMMVVLGLPDETIEAIVTSARNKGKEVWAANYNTDGQLVLAGNRSDLEPLAAVLKEAGAKRAMLLNMSVASHCPMLAPAVGPLLTLLDERVQEPFSAPVISNATSRPYSTKNEALSVLEQQLTGPVLYKQSVVAIEKDVDLFIELGHGTVLKGMHKKITEVPTISVGDMASLEAAIATLKD